MRNSVFNMYLKRNDGNTLIGILEIIEASVHRS